MPTRIDLHLHSTYSDGRQTPAEVFRLAMDNGIEALSLTDHDSTRSLAEAREAEHQFGLKFIAGTEVTTMYEGKILHMVAYNFDPDNAKLQQTYARLMASRRDGVMERMREASQRLAQDSGPAIDLADFEASQKGYFNRWKAIDYLLEKNLVKDREQALDYVKGAKIGAAEISPQAAIELIHGAGGKAVLAHAFGPQISLKTLRGSLDEQKQIIKELKEAGLDGLECYQPSHSQADTAEALLIAKEFDLVATGGTDWHGPLAVVGEGIKAFIPNYVDHPGQLDIPEADQQKMMEFFFD